MYKSGVNKHPFRGTCRMGFPDSYVVIDTETTGLSPQNCRLIEVAAIRYEKGVETARFSELIQPGCTVNYYITKLTGITNEALEDARSEAEVLPEYLAFIGDSMIVGHNVTFDIGFLEAAADRCFGSHFSNDYVDTMLIGRKVLPRLPHHRLQDLAMYYSVSYEGAHRAVNDCAITHKCLQKMKEDVIRRTAARDGESVNNEAK